MRVAVVGSGPAGVAAAQGLVDGGISTDLLDFGNEMDNSSLDLATRLRNGSRRVEDLVQLRPPRADRGFFHSVGHLFACLLGRAPILDLMDKTRIGSRFAFEDVEWGIPVEGSAIAARSLGKAGLSNVWGAAAYPLTNEDYTNWPITKADMEPHYEKIARLLSLFAHHDDLAAAYPTYTDNSQTLPLNPSAAMLLDHWQRNRELLVSQGILCGRSRLAVRVADTDMGLGCKLCGLCLYGCPYDSIYRAEWTLSALSQRSSFRYVNDLWVRSFQEKENQIVVDTFRKGNDDIFRKGNDENPCIKYDALFLAAGTLSSLRIAADAQGQHGRVSLLQDNDLYLVPFLRTVTTDAPAEPLHFTLNELSLRISTKECPIHVQFYCVSDQIIDRFRPLLRIIPSVIRNKVENLLKRLSVAFIYLPGEVSAPTSALVKSGTPVGTVSIHQQRARNSRRIVRRLLRQMHRNRKAIGLRRVGPAIRSAPSGPGGGHLVGALPMKQQPGPLETHPDGRLYGTERVYVVDGALLPSLPAQNSTFTIMANAHRIATLFSQRHNSQSTTESSSDIVQSHVELPRSSSVANDAQIGFGKDHVEQAVLDLDHDTLQYNGSIITAFYHRFVLRKAVRLARLRAGMHVLDYGCGKQQLRKVISPFVAYLGYDAQSELSDVDDPRGRTYDVVFAIQVLMYLDASGLRNFVDTIAASTTDLIVMVPSRNFLKDQILDRVFGLSSARDDMVKSVPVDIYTQLARKFSLCRSKNLLWMGELTRWQRK